MPGVERNRPRTARPARWLRGFALASLTALGSGCATQLDTQSAATTVPYRLDHGGRVVVDVMLNGHGPFAFLLDTGASISGVSASLRERLGLMPQRSQVLIHGLTRSSHLPVARAGEIALGDARWRDVRVAILPDDHSAIEDHRGVTSAPDGILGSDLLRDYAAGFATRERVLRLFRPEAVSATRYVGWRSIALHAGAERTPAALMLFFDLDIEGRRARALFDLGAGFNVVNWAAARQLGLSPERYARRGDDLKGVFDPQSRAPRFVARHTQTASVSWRDEEYSIADLQIFSTFGLNDQPAAIIGAGLFAQRDFLIDFRRSRLLVSVADGERSTH